MDAIMKPTDVLPVDAALAAGFAQEQFGHADLAHKARNAALVRCAQQLCRHPGGTLPNKMASPRAYKSMDALMNRPEVTHGSVLASHRQRTQEKMVAAQGAVLILHDTTELDYAGLSIPELGPIGNGSRRGYLCHNSLAVDPETREALGLVQQILHARAPVPAKETIKAKRERPSRESRLWSRAVRALRSVPPGKVWIDVADCGADLFEFLATERQLGRKCLVRASQDRCIRVGHEDHGAGDQAGDKRAGDKRAGDKRAGDEADKTMLFGHLRTLPAQGSTKTKKLFERSQAEERQATLAIAYAAVQLLPPQIKRGEYQERALPAWGVRIWEIKPPQGVEPVEWFLITFEPITTLAQAWQASSWYECRFVVEEHHKAKKTGCQIEDLQFATAQALEPMVALLSVVAVMLLNLRQACRQPNADQRQATEVVDKKHEEILRMWRYQQPRAEMSIKEFYMAVARLGGHMNRKSDGNPGWLTLWRGWTKLQLMVDGAEAERRRKKFAG
jgi:hypothetical protein